MKRQGIGRSQAIRYIDKLDHYRESYYKYHTGRQWKRVETTTSAWTAPPLGWTTA